MTIDLKTIAIVGVFVSGEVCGMLPNTAAGRICGLCIALFAGFFGGRLARRGSAGGSP